LEEGLPFLPDDDAAEPGFLAFLGGIFSWRVCPMECIRI